jgi:bacterial/archaeal transporter family protein
MWIVFAVLAAVLAGVSVTLTKAGLEKVDPFLAFAIQAIFIIIIAWTTVLLQKNAVNVTRMDKKAWLFVGLAGIATCFSSLSQFKALKMGNASAVAPIVNSSLVFSVLFAALFLKEQLNWRVIVGVLMIIGGVILVALSRKGT